MLKRIATILLVVISLSLPSHAALAAVGGLKGYVNTTNGYEFLYPNGWVEVKVSGGPDVVFRDLIEATENVSVVINPTSANKTLESLGSPGEVGYQLLKNAIAPPGSNRQAELVSADMHQVGDKTYYTLDYTVKLPSQRRHNLASIVVSRGKLYTFNASTTERRWPKVQALFQDIVNSFSVR